MAVAEALPDFLTARENYLRAMGRHNEQERLLFKLFGVGSLAELDLAMLNERHQHVEQVQKYNALGLAFDRAADIYDRAAARQREKIRKQQKQFHADIATLDE